MTGSPIRAEAPALAIPLRRRRALGRDRPHAPAAAARRRRARAGHPRSRGASRRNVAAALARAGRPVGADRRRRRRRRRATRCVAGLEAAGVDVRGVYRAPAPTDAYVAIEDAAGALHAAVADCRGLERGGTRAPRPLRDGRLAAPGAPWRGTGVLDGNLPEAVIAALLRTAPRRAASRSYRRAREKSAAPRGRSSATRPVTLYLNRAEAEALCGAAFADSRAAAQARSPPCRASPPSSPMERPRRPRDRDGRLVTRSPPPSRRGASPAPATPSSRRIWPPAPKAAMLPRRSNGRSPPPPATSRPRRNHDPAPRFRHRGRRGDRRPPAARRARIDDRHPRHALPRRTSRPPAPSRPRSAPPGPSRRRIAVAGGAIRVGLEPAELEALAGGDRTSASCRAPISPSPFPRAGPGSTTVAATMICARLAGIEVFATGGIGGVHRGAERELRRLGRPRGARRDRR